MKTFKKFTALGVAVVVAVSVPLQYAFAAPASVKIDETLYVNLNPYGGIKDLSVVKGYMLNEGTTVTDYGTYENVINMSNYAEPEIKDGKVTFIFDEKTDRFYFEGKLKKEQVALPWAIDVTYKLNGVEKNAEQLAGEKGLVEITIDAIPNKKASVYFQNNMMLQVATSVNMDDNLSVEAPGAQLQTLGNIKAIVFMAMPGEEQHFTIRIGSDDFSFGGLYMLMIPGTLSQIEDIRKLKESKEKIEDSADAASDSLDVLLATMENLQSGLNQTADGLRNLDAARNTISQSKDEVYDNADEALDSLKGLSEAAGPFVGHLDTTKDMLNEMNDSLNKVTNTAKDFKPIISDAQNAIGNIQTDLESLKAMVEDMDENTQDRITVTSRTNRDLDDLRDTMVSLSSSLNNNNLSSMPSISGITEMPNPNNDPTIAMVNAKIAEINGLIGMLGSVGGAISGETGSTLSTTGDLITRSEKLVDDIDNALVLFDKYMSAAESRTGDITALTDDMNALLESLNNSLVLADGLIDDASSLTDVLNKYEEDTEQSVVNAKALVEKAITGIDSTHKFLSTARSVAEESGASLDIGTEAVLNGMVNAINVSLAGLGQTSTLQNAKDTIKNTIDDEWDEYSEDKMTFLNMDETLDKESFTSQLNPPPESVQIVLRTDEITVDDDDESINMDEDFHAEGNFITRIINIFKQIALKITTLFTK